MRTKIIVVLFAVVLAGSVIVSGEPHNAQSINGGATEQYTGKLCDLGIGFPPVPGGKIRGFSIEYQTTAQLGPIFEFLDGFKGCAVINANLDENLSGPAWGTWAYSKGDMTWEGTLNGPYNWALNAGSWHVEGHGRGPGIEGRVISWDAVNIGTGIDYLFVTISGKPKH
jgi:hypothetical protein